ncbi:MAG: hypothetical protein WC802_03380 [Patescibacteria group bacterium]|jgi:hypothetical protein
MASTHKHFVRKLSRSALSLFFGVTAMIVGPLLQIGVLTQYAHAAGISVASDTMTNQATSATSTHTLVWTSSGSNVANDTIAVGFVVADFTFNLAGAWQTTDFTLSDGSHAIPTAPLAVGAAPACTATDNYTVTVAPVSSTLTITFCSGWVSGTSPTTFTVYGTATTGAGTVTNNASNVESSIISITYASTNTTSGNVAVAIEPNADVVITATVNSTLTFNVSDNTIGFGVLSSTAAAYANGAGTGSATPVTAHTFDVATNAGSGFTVTISGPTLTSGANTITAIGGSNTASATGTEQFGVRYTEAGGTGATVTAPYAAAGYAYDGIAAPSQVASSTGATATATYDAIYLANIAGATEAGAYSTTINYVATGHF